MKLVLNRRISNQNLLQTIIDIDELKYREEVELLSTQYARNMAIAIIKEAAKIIPDCFFRPWIGGDETGGVRAIWSRSNFNAQVRLIVPPNIDRQICIYHKFGLQDELEYNVSGVTLAERIVWLCQVEPPALNRGVLAVGFPDHAKNPSIWAAVQPEYSPVLGNIGDITTAKNA